jgi:hypothetical protein
METFYNSLVAENPPPLFHFTYFIKFELHSQQKGCFKASADQRVHSYPVSDFNFPVSTWKRMLIVSFIYLDNL